MNEHRIYTTAFGDVYPHYVAKAKKKDRTKKEVDEIIDVVKQYRCVCASPMPWATRYTIEHLEGVDCVVTGVVAWWAESRLTRSAQEAIAPVRSQLADAILDGYQASAPCGGPDSESVPCTPLPCNGAKVVGVAGCAIFPIQRSRAGPSPGLE